MAGFFSEEQLMIEKVDDQLLCYHWKKGLTINVTPTKNYQAPHGVAALFSAGKSPITVAKTGF